MILIAITGVIGSGKSELCKILKRDFNIPVIHLDLITKHLYRFDTKLKNKIIKLFGNEILTEKKIDYAKLAKRIFNNKTELKKLEELVHPAVFKFTEKLISYFKKKKYEIVAVESALITKKNYYKRFDYIILVKCKNKIRLTRLKKDYRIRNLFQDSLSLQKISDFTIINNGTLKDLKIKTGRVLNKIINIDKN